MTRVVLHIDRLVLHGVPMAERAAWLRHFEAELVHALSRPGAALAWATAGQQPRLRCTGPTTGSGGVPERAGAAARALARAPAGGRP